MEDSLEPFATSRKGCDCKNKKKDGHLKRRTLHGPRRSRKEDSGEDDYSDEYKSRRARSRKKSIWVQKSDNVCSHLEKPVPFCVCLGVDKFEFNKITSAIIPGWFCNKRKLYR
ncbi:hypothetical protein GE061_004297 [Apolygus lucorum]|uniref:Uncharacterized protein n=1 Tax=Apolygus lucorum TaxID=248454 RepID=A0A8S9X0P4_APOLU|nr:hypothetical protein GE061_004297 [Apolygus lucorum]